MNKSNATNENSALKKAPLVEPPDGSKTPAKSDGSPMAEFITTKQVSELTAFSPKTLEAWRSKRTGPPYSVIGHRVRYRLADVRAWLASHATVQCDCGKKESTDD